MGRGEMQLYMKLMDKRLVAVHKWLHDMHPLSTDRLRISLLQLMILY